ncbi:MAG: hypothetical protein LAT64_00775 [Phycisphaerales bacterium]|nr:hypothetical protein [Planctomycetota bacterium]MCH8507295.1 hypothetical protein [Phycisphaerales bacterium]
MIEVVARWTARGMSLLVIGPLAAWAAGMVRAPDGSDTATLLTGATIGGGLVGLVLVGLCVITAGAIGARLADRHEAVLNAGFVLAWVAWTIGAMHEVIRLSPASGTLIRFAIEAGLLAGLVLAAWVVADRLSRRGSDEEGFSLSPASIAGAVGGKAGPVVVLASAAVGLACAWLFARHGAPGQGLGAAFLGGLGAGVVGAQTFQSMTKDDKGAMKGATPVLVPVMVGVMLAGVIAPVMGLFVPGSGRLIEGLSRGSLPGWVLISPAAWCSGALLGAPMGAAMMRPSARDEAEGTVTSMISHRA